MGTIHKCDKCGKIIKQGGERLNFLSMSSTTFEKFGISNDICICGKCFKQFIKFLKAFLNLKKIVK